MDLVFVAIQVLLVAATGSAMFWQYEKHHRRGDGSSRSFLGYLLGQLFAGFVASAIGPELLTALDDSCDSSAGCALAVVGFAAPAFFCGGMLVFIATWVSMSKQQTGN
jgi:hypothetical protein